MTITTELVRAGAPATARRLTNLAAPLMPLHIVNGAFANATIHGNFAIGRNGQLMVVDRLDIETVGNPGAAATQVVGFRDANLGGTAGTDLYFNLKPKTAGEGWCRELSFDKFGYVAQPDFTQVGTGVQASRQEAQRKLAIFSADDASTGNETAEIAGWLRYVERESAYQKGIKPGEWGSKIYFAALGAGFTATETVLAAPGAGFFYRIHTLIIFGVGAATNNRVVVGTNATPANAPLIEFYSAVARNGFALQVAMTDTDIPCPENTPVVVGWETGYDSTGSIIVGAEKCTLSAGHNLVNLTGVAT